jgi:hypothetical protein
MEYADNSRNGIRRTINFPDRLAFCCAYRRVVVFVLFGILFSSTVFSGNIIFTKALRGSSIASGGTASVFTDAYSFTTDNTEAADIAIHVRLYLAEDRFLEYQNKAKFGVSRYGESRKIGVYTVTPTYDANNQNIVAYNAVREFESGGKTNYRTEYQMEPGDLSDFTNNVKLYEAAANLVYVTGEPDWRSIAMYDNLMNGDIRGGAKELGNIWSDALTNPNFWMSVATSVAVSNAGGKTISTTKGVAVPKGWITQASKKRGGLEFVDPKNPHNRIRQMPGNPNTPNSAQQNPYVKFMKDGKFYDANGNPLKNGDLPEAHIPLDKFDMNKMPKFE